MTEIEDILPLAPLQEGLYFHSVSQPQALDMYTMQSTYSFHTAPDPNVVAQALRTLMRRHTALRAGFMHKGLEQCVQFIPSAATITTPFRTEHTDSAGLAHVERTERETRFDLDRPPLVRAVLVNHPDGSASLVITNHHIIMDGWSDALFVVELAHHIAAGGEDTTLSEPVQFRAFLEYIAALDHDDIAAAWANALDGLKSPCLVAPNATASSVLPLVIERELDPEVSRGVETFARTHHISVSTFYATVWALALRDLTGSNDAVFGVTVSGRPPELEGVDTCLGLFLNTLPLRITLRPAESVAELVRRVQREQAALMDAHHVSLASVQQRAGLGTLFDTLYVMRNTPEGDGELDTAFAAAGIADVAGGDATHYPLTFITHPGEAYTLMLSYQSSFASHEAAAALMARCHAYVSLLLAHPNVPLGLALESLPQVKQGVPMLGSALSASGLVQQLIEVTASEKNANGLPARTALACGAERVSFAELCVRSAGIAALLTAAGVGAGDVVALALPRGINVVAAIFGCFAMRAAYVPLDVTHPGAVQVDAVVQSGAVAVLHAGEFAAEVGVPLLDVAGAPRGCELRLAAGYDHADLAYVMFTSGSTGRPKGVAVAHTGLVNMLSNHVRRIFEPALAYSPQRVRRVAHTVPFSFDMSWEELLWLLQGHEVHIADDWLRKDPEALTAYLAAQAIDVINVTPTVAQALISEGLCTPDGPNPELVLLGGEAVTDQVWQHLRRAPQSHGYNLYGPTEYTINTLGGGTEDSATPTVGVPIDNTSVFLLDAALFPVAQGVPGELYIQGAGLAWGYVGQSAMTAERFVPCPFGAPGERMYRTGDVASWRADGQLDFHGRSDDQVKIRGVRIEVAHVNACIAAAAGVAQAVTVVRTAATGTPILVSYVVPEVGFAGDLVVEVQAHAVARLAPAMVPQAVVVLRALPLTSNGKLDAAALPNPVAASREPVSQFEHELVAIFAEVLGLSRVAVDADFFVLGGHSLLVMKLVGLVAQRYDVAVPLASFAQYGTPELLAQFVAQQVEAPGVAAPEVALFSEVIELSPHNGETPIVCLHPAGGLGWSFAQLAGQLPEFPVFAVQSPFLLGADCEGDVSLSGLVDLVVSRILTEVLAPAGVLRVHLLGWSFGAHVAHMAVARLEAQGVRVESLTLLDATALPPARSASQPKASPATTAEACRFLLATSGRLVPEGLRNEPELAGVIDFLLDSQSSWSALSRTQLERVVFTYERNVSLLAQARYEPTGVPTLLCSAGVEPDPTQEASWQPYCHDLRRIVVPAQHHFMTTPAASAHVAPELAQHVRASAFTRTQ